jgi:hypothetical protein
MLLYGDGFYYDSLANGRLLFEKIEVLIEYWKQTEITVRLSTPSEYFDQVKQSEISLLTYEGDYLPLMTFKDNGRDYYWTGFYCSKPELKRKIAKALDLVRSAKLLAALVLKEDFDTKDADFGLHHDAITGTSKARVDESYRDNVDAATAKAERKISEAFEQLSKPDFKEIETEYRPLVVFNPVNWRRTQLIEVETNSLHVKVLDSALQPVPAQVVQTPQDKSLVLFNANLAGLSFGAFFILQYDSACEDCASFSSEVLTPQLHMGNFTVDLDKDCNVKRMVQDGEEVEINARFVKYTSTKGGTYIFKPNTFGETLTDIELTTCKVYQGPVAAVAFAEWRRSSSTSNEPYRQRLIVGPHSDALKWQFEVSPSPGEDLFLRLEGEDFKGEPWFHTFNSGDLRRRLYKANAESYTVGMNYYPLPGALVAGSLPKALTIVPEFPTGAGFPTKERNIDLHLHRNIQQDEGFGVGEKLDDTAVTVHTFHVSFGRVTHKGLWQQYLTGKHSFQLFSVTSQSPLELSSRPLKEAGALVMPWSYSNWAELGLTSEDVYLSSASWRSDHVVVKLLEIAETDVQLDWQNLALIEERNLGGFDKAKSPVSLAGKGALVNADRKESGYPVALRPLQPDVVVNGFELRGLQTFAAHFSPKQPQESNEVPSDDLERKGITWSEVAHLMKDALTAESTFKELDNLVYSVAVGLSLLAVASVLACRKKSEKKD